MTNSTTDNLAGLDRVKGEAAFFMEKTFQVSFGYLGALIALVGAASLDVAAAVAAKLGLSVTALLCCGVLVVNVVYLALAAGLLFATVKRGLFLVLASDEGNGHHAWEYFLRQGGASRGGGRLQRAAWNLDNFYMAPLFILIFLVSALAAVVGIDSAGNLRGTFAVGIATALHVLPLAMLLATAKMTRELEGSLDRG